MPRTIEVLLYQFDELTDKAKEKARQWYREASAGDNYYAKSVKEDACEIAKLMGITFKERQYKTVGGYTRYEPCIWWSGFWSQGDGACFEGSYEHKADCLATVTAYAPKDEKLHVIARDLQESGLGLRATITHRDRYYHAYTMEIDLEPVADEGEPISDEVRKRVVDAFRDFANWIYRQLEHEYEHHNADEQIDETIRVNEYEFKEDGRRAHC